MTGQLGPAPASQVPTITATPMNNAAVYPDDSGAGTEDYPQVYPQEVPALSAGSAAFSQWWGQRRPLGLGCDQESHHPQQPGHGGLLEEQLGGLLGGQLRGQTGRHTGDQLGDQRRS